MFASCGIEWHISFGGDVVMITQLFWNQQSIINGVRGDAMKGLRAGAEFLLTETIKTTPKDEGILIQSGKVSHDSSKVEAAVSFDTPYAVRLHEHPEYNFQNGRRGKYLEKTLNEQRQTLINLIAQVMQGGMN
jgi:hypothetical protein